MLQYKDFKTCQTIDFLSFKNFKVNFSTLNKHLINFTKITSLPTPMFRTFFNFQCDNFL